MIVVGKNLKDVGERPSCPQCSSPNPVSKGSSWKCRVCYREWQKSYRGHVRKNLDRPSCSFCGASSDKIWVHGDRWLCSVCCKSWSRVRQPKRKDMGERPPCPMCGAPEPISYGDRWECLRCSKTWKKWPRMAICYSELDLRRASVVEI